MINLAYLTAALCLFLTSIGQLKAAASPLASAKGIAFFNSITIPVIDLENLSLAQSRDVILSRAYELDKVSSPPEQRGFKIQPFPAGYENIVINYKARSISLSDCLIEIAKQAKLDIYLTSNGVIFTKPGAPPLRKASKETHTIWKVLLSH